MQQLDIVRTSPSSTGPMKANVIRCWLSGRRGLVIGGIVVVVAGMALGWNWLTTIGVAP